jgi:hypothetical protein
MICANSSLDESYQWSHHKRDRLDRRESSVTAIGCFRPTDGCCQMVSARCAEGKGWHAMCVLCALTLSKTLESMPSLLQIGVAGPLPVAVSDG